MITIWNIQSPAASAISKMTAPMAPGPAIRGVANGKTATSSLSTASLVSSLVVDVLPEERAKTISMPMRKAKTNKMAKLMAVPRKAIERRSLGVALVVIAANMAATSNGPMVAKKVVKATIAISFIKYASVTNPLAKWRYTKEMPRTSESTRLSTTPV